MRFSAIFPIVAGTLFLCGCRHYETAPPPYCYQPACGCAPAPQCAPGCSPCPTPCTPTPAPYIAPTTTTIVPPRGNAYNTPIPPGATYSNNPAIPPAGGYNGGVGSVYSASGSR
jgi:hypothetical protein